MVNLGDMYRRGFGVPQDHVEAMKWYTLAAVMGDEAAIYARFEIARAMTPEQAEDAARRAAEWLAQHDAWMKLSDCTTSRTCERQSAGSRP